MGTVIRDLEKIEHFPEGFFQLLIMLLEIATPFGRIPDFQPVKNAHHHDFQVVFQRDDFSQPSGNEDSARLVDFRRRGFSHDEVHEEPALIFIERVFDACEDFFPILEPE